MGVSYCPPSKKEEIDNCWIVRYPLKSLRGLTRGICQFVLLTLYFVLEAFGITSCGCDLSLHLLSGHFGGHCRESLLRRRRMLGVIGGGLLVEETLEV